MSFQGELIFEIFLTFFAAERLLIGPFDNGRFGFGVSDFFDDQLRIQRRFVFFDNRSEMLKLG
jgi:hypothetical protein